MLYYFSCSQIEAWLSLVERCVRDAEVAGSNPVASTINGDLSQSPFCFFLTSNFISDIDILLFSDYNYLWKRRGYYGII